MPFHSVKENLPEKPDSYEIRTTFGQRGLCYFNGDKFGRFFSPLDDDRGLKIELDCRNQITHWRCI